MWRILAQPLRSACEFTVVSAAALMRTNHEPTYLIWSLRFHWIMPSVGNRCRSAVALLFYPVSRSGNPENSTTWS
jgi:hypothetical protein